MLIATKNLIEKRYYLIITLLVLILLTVRNAPSLIHDYPLGVGGFYYSMIEAIRGCGVFCYPESVPYYGENGLPFVYPPIGLYITAFFDYITPHGDILSTMKVVSFLVTSANLLLFSLFSWSELSRIGSIISVFVFGTIPATFVNSVGAPATVRGVGFLFLMMGLVYYTFYRDYHGTSTNAVVLAVCAALACLTHPIAGLCTVGIFGIGLMIDSFRLGLRPAKCVEWIFSYAITGILIVLPFIGMLFWRQHQNIFLEGTDSRNPIRFIPEDLLFRFTMEPYVDIWAALGMISLIYALWSRNLFLFFSFIFTLLITLPYFGNYPSLFISVIIGCYVAESRLGLSDRYVSLYKSVQFPVWVLTLLIIMAYGLGQSITFSITAGTPIVGAAANHHELVKLTNQTYDSFKWLDREADNDDRVLFISPPSQQNKVEWGPALSHTQAAKMKYGAEWIGKYHEWQDLNEVLANESCLINSINKFKDSEGFVPEYIYTLSLPQFKELGPCPNRSSLSLSKEFESNKIVVWKVDSTVLIN